MARSFWRVKSEPFKYSWDDLVKDGSTYWDGVRNALARNHITRNSNHRKFSTREKGGRQAQTTLSVNVRRHGGGKLVRQDRVGSANSARDLHQKGRRQPIL